MFKLWGQGSHEAAKTCTQSSAIYIMSCACMPKQAALKGAAIPAHTWSLSSAAERLLAYSALTALFGLFLLGVAFLRLQNDVIDVGIWPLLRTAKLCGPLRPFQWALVMVMVFLLAISTVYRAGDIAATAAKASWTSAVRLIFSLLAVLSGVLLILEIEELGGVQE